MSNAVTGETKEHTEQQRVLLLQLKGPPFNLQEVVSTEIRKTFITLVIRALACG